ncbi:MAG TPA: DUF599 family protein [Hyphomicrobiaceae bacterium]|jgi:uncharacterized membrane protein|nr:DUF599 family protein [Hyphomicrobiaceae bacterium]
MALDTLAPPLDALAFAYFVCAVGLYRFVAGRLLDRSLVGAIQEHRIRWMLNMARRENRMLDAILLGSLSQGNAFFASTSVIAVGGLAATLGAGDKVQAVLANIPYLARSTPFLWDVKQILIMWIFVYAFFKFAWAFRLSHYGSIMIGAAPLYNDTHAEACAQHAERTARLIGIAGEHNNSGIRSFYYAIATLAWFFHPLLFMLATTWVILILARRDFFSRALSTISGHG